MGRWWQEGPLIQSVHPSLPVYSPFRIPRIQGMAETSLQADADLSSMTHRKAWSRPPIEVDFQVLMFTASGLLVRFLKVFEKSNYQSVKVSMQCLSTTQTRDANLLPLCCSGCDTSAVQMAPTWFVSNLWPPQHARHLLPLPPCTCRRSEMGSNGIDIHSRMQCGPLHRPFSCPCR